MLAGKINMVNNGQLRQQRPHVSRMQPTRMFVNTELCGTGCILTVLFCTTKTRKLQILGFPFSDFEGGMVPSPMGREGGGDSVRKGGGLIHISYGCLKF